MGTEEQADGLNPPWEKAGHGVEGNYAMKDGIQRGTVRAGNANIKSRHSDSSSIN